MTSYLTLTLGAGVISEIDPGISNDSGQGDGGATHGWLPPFVWILHNAINNEKDEIRGEKPDELGVGRRHAVLH